MSDAQLFLNDDVTVATSIVFPSTDAGATSSAVELHLWYRKGTPGGRMGDVTAHLEILFGGVWVTLGVPALDQHWFEARVNGGNNAAADPAWVPETGDWVALGTGVKLAVSDLLGNTARYLEIRLHPPLAGGASSETVTWRLVVAYNDRVEPAPPGLLAAVGHGIFTGVNERRIREWVTPPAVTPTGTPDDQVHVSGGLYVYDGAELAPTTTDALTLNQNDGASAALASGQEYVAVLSRPADNTTAAVVTKGLKAATGAAVAPALPAGHLLVATVLVVYGVSGSVIDSAHITILATYGRAYPRAGTGLTLLVGSLRALAGSSVVRISGESVVVLPASSTRRVWLDGSAIFQLGTGTAPPTVGLTPIADVTTDGTGVTGVTNLRRLIDLASGGSTSGPSWTKHSYAFTDWSGFAEGAHTLTIPVPGGTVVHGMIVHCGTLWTATGASWVFVQIGDDVNGDTAYQDGTLHIDASADWSAPFCKPVGFSGTHEIRVRVGSDVNLTNLTAGTMDLYIFASTLP
jgi:hypothetical protein